MPTTRRQRVAVLRPRHIVIALLCGLALNAVIVLLSVYATESPVLVHEWPPPPNSGWPLSEPSKESIHVLPGFTRLGRGWLYDAEEITVMDGATGARSVVLTRRDGWPWAALAQYQITSGGGAYRALVPDPSRPRRVVAPTSSEHRGSVEVFERRVPYVPVWVGLIGNTLVLALITLTLLLAPGILVRWRRAARGRCTACAYDLAGLATCPECGAASSSA